MISALPFPLLYILCSTRCTLTRTCYLLLTTRRDYFMPSNFKCAITSILFRLIFIKHHLPRLQKRLRDLRKQLFDVYANFSTRLYKLHTEFISFLLSFVRADLSLFSIIYFVAH